MPTKLDGKKVAKDIESQLISEVEILQDHYDEVPYLAIFMVGHNPSSIKYTRMKALACDRIGIQSTLIDLPEESEPPYILSAIHEFNLDPRVHGIMLQHPVPAHLSLHERSFFDIIYPEKDVDGLNSISFGGLALRNDPCGWMPATARGILTLLHKYNIFLSGLTATIVGSSPILGLPLSMLLHRAGVTVCIANIDSKPEHVRKLCQMSDIVVGACGVPGIITPDMVKEDVILVDAGCSPENVGDIDPACYEKSKCYTPLPGGVGPMTTITLLKQTVQAAKEQVSERNRRRPVGGAA